MAYSTVLFDFDGTLFDSSEGVFNSFDKVVEHYGLKIDKLVYNKMIGPPLKFSFKEYFNLPENEISNAIDVYRSYYSIKGMFECRVYDGIEGLLANLKAAGKKIIVATSKPEVYAEKIIERKGLLQYFDFIGGSDIEEKSRVEKIDVINYVISQNSLENSLDDVIMIGDRHFDVNGAHSAGIKCIGVLWGFGNRAEFSECGADFIAETPSDVMNFV